MGHGTGMRRHRNDLALFAALIAVLLVPMSVPAVAAEPALAASLSMQAGAESAYAAPAAETSADAAIRTSGTLAAIVVATSVVVLVWWYLVVRRRRD